MDGAHPLMSFAEPVTLRGRHVVLVPLDPSHVDDLKEASGAGDLWKTWYTSVAPPERMGAEIERRLAAMRAGSMLPFTVVDPATGRAVGMTTYMNIDAVNRRVEIGSTWYARSVQRTGLNTEAKLLLLTHAFEALDCIAVEFRTHWMNHQSRDAIARLGAKQDGRAASSHDRGRRDDPRHRGLLDRRGRVARGAQQPAPSARRPRGLMVPRRSPC